MFTIHHRVMNYKILLIIVLCTVTTTYAQGRKTSYDNRIGLGADLTYVQLQNDHVQINSGTGFMVTAGTRGEFRDDFDLVYGVSIFSNNFSVQENGTLEAIDLNMIGVEFRLLLAWKVAQSDYFSIEAGPAVMLHSEFRNDDNRFENAVIGGANAISLNSFKEVSPFNVNGVVGFSGGSRDLRLTVHYHYGFIDTLAGKDLAGTNLKGNVGFATAGLRFYF